MALVDRDEYLICSLFRSNYFVIHNNENLSVLSSLQVMKNVLELTLKVFFLYYIVRESGNEIPHRKVREYVRMN